jgi:hypothetical protein
MRPSSLRRLKKIVARSTVIFGVFTTGLVIVNVVDAFPYWRAIRCVERLTPADLQMIVDAGARLESGGYQVFEGNEIPLEFRPLKPVRVSISPNLADVSFLKDGGPIYAFIRISRNPQNHEAVFVHPGRDRQYSKILWERNPAFTRQLSPEGRIVTVSQNNMRSAREWIVLPAELLVIDRVYTAGDADRLATRIPLHPEHVTAINTAVNTIPADIRGHAFDSGGMDGTQLGISFAPDGKRRSDDIILANMWREELEPLTNAINQIVNKEDRVLFPDQMRERSEVFGAAALPPPGQPTVFNLEEYERKQNYLPLPWWCIWPRLGLL